jgi:hypothetical protein
VRKDTSRRQTKAGKSGPSGGLLSKVIIIERAQDPLDPMSKVAVEAAMERPAKVCVMSKPEQGRVWFYSVHTALSRASRGSLPDRRRQYVFSLDAAQHLDRLWRRIDLHQTLLVTSTCTYTSP